ncbi:hypothetical protein WJX84_000162, partial [Apatococcus fuscideae]
QMAPRAAAGSEQAASNDLPPKAARGLPRSLAFLSQTVQHVVNNLWPILVLHAAVDLLLFLSYRVLHRILNQVAVTYMSMDPALIGNPWWVAASFDLNQFNTGYGRMMGGCFLVMLLYSLLLKCFANCATIMLCREGIEGMGLSWRPPIRRAIGAARQAAAAVRPLFGQVAQVELLVWVRLLPLLAFSLLLLPLPLTLPRIGNLLLATPVALLEGTPEDLAMKRAIRVVDGYRRPLLIAMAIPVALVRVLNGAKQGGLMMLPARYFKELPEIPIGAYILLVGATVILCRIRELLPYTVQLGRSQAAMARLGSFVIAAVIPLLVGQAVANDLLVACPMQLTTTVKTLSIASNKPVSQQENTGTNFISWLYTDVTGTTSCTNGTRTELDDGDSIEIPGTSVEIVRVLDELNVTSGSETGILHINDTSVVAVCNDGELYIMEVEDDGEVTGQVTINANTSCIGTNAVAMDSMLGASNPSPSVSKLWADSAGIPVAGFTIPAAAPATATGAAACTGQPDGYGTGLTADFYAWEYPSSSSVLSQFPLNFSGPADFTRCDCPNHETVNASWPGYPSLPPQGYINNYGVRMTGQFLVERPSSGVIGETPAIYPTASDYHLICLQHDDSAQMIVDGVSYYESESPVASIAGYKQYCEPIELAPGYHNLELRYGKSPLSTSSTFKFFVINAEQVNTVVLNGQSTYDIQWQGQGTCCTGPSGVACSFASAPLAAFTEITTIPGGDMVAVQASFSVGFTGPAGSYLGMFAQLNTSAVGGASVSAMTMSPATTIGNQQFFNLNFTSSINDPFTCLQTIFNMSGSFLAYDSSNQLCASQQFNTSSIYCSQPVCNMYATDMAFRGSEGLVTSRDSALIVLACTQEVTICEDCFSVSGPSSPSVAFFNQVDSSNSTYQLMVDWEPSYRGPITVGLQAARTSQQCSLDLAAPICEYDTVSDVGPLSFTVDSGVQVMASAFRILYACTGPQCSIAGGIVPTYDGTPAVGAMGSSSATLGLGR